MCEKFEKVSFGNDAVVASRAREIEMAKGGPDFGVKGKVAPVFAVARGRLGGETVHVLRYRDRYCTAIINCFNGFLYADDLYGVVDPDKFKLLIGEEMPEGDAMPSWVGPDMADFWAEAVAGEYLPN